MGTELSDQIRELIDAGAEPVTCGEIAERGPAARWSPAGRRRAVGRGAVVLAAVGGVAVVALVVVPGARVGGAGRATGGGGPGARVVLTAAMVAHVASASRSALALSGRAVVGYRSSQQGVPQQYGTDEVTFSGANWNFVLDETLPAAGGQPGQTQHAINRVVDGQAYYYFPTTTSTPQWVHDTNPDAVHALGIPDPRTVLGVLEPGARFEVVGWQVVGGVRMEHLRATSVSGLAGALATLPEVMPGENVTALDLWVDGQGVVHRMNVEFAGRIRVWDFTPAQLARLKDAKERHLPLKKVLPALKAGAKASWQTESTSLSVTFTEMGQPQVITAPRSYTNVYGLG